MSGLAGQCPASSQPQAGVDPTVECGGSDQRKAELDHEREDAVRASNSGTVPSLHA